MTLDVGRGRGTVSFDLSSFKDVKIDERITSQFRVEAHNIINHGIFSSPSGAVRSPGAVCNITATSMDNRRIQRATNPEVLR